VAAPVDVPGEVEAGAGGDLAEEGKLGDLAVLELDVAEAVEGLLVGPVEEAEGIVELEGGLGAELALEGREGRGGPGGRSRGEGGGGGDEEECAAEEEEEWSKVSFSFRSKQKQISTQHSPPHSSPRPSC
jgi:hypothetical protein